MEGGHEREGVGAGVRGGRERETGGEGARARARAPGGRRGRGCEVVAHVVYLFLLL